MISSSINLLFSDFTFGMFLYSLFNPSGVLLVKFCAVPSLSWLFTEIHLGYFVRFYFFSFSILSYATLRNKEIYVVAKLFP